jgi:hypothetical protein
VTEKFLKKYKLLYLIRSHECKPEGYELTHGSKVQHTTLCFLNSHCSLRLIVRSNLKFPTFATRLLYASPREISQRRKVELWARNVREFCLNADIHVIFRDLLHAVKLRHGNDGFTSPPKEWRVEEFFALKIRRLRPGVNPRTWVPKASTLPLDHPSHYSTLHRALINVNAGVGQIVSSRTSGKQPQWVNLLTLSKLWGLLTNLAAY